MTEQPPDEVLWTALFGEPPDLELSTEDQATYDAIFKEH